jgi:hypothetical protein
MLQANNDNQPLDQHLLLRTHQVVRLFGNGGMLPYKAFSDKYLQGGRVSAPETHPPNLSQALEQAQRTKRHRYESTQSIVVQVPTV